MSLLKILLELFWRCPADFEGLSVWNDFWRAMSIFWPNIQQGQVAEHIECLPIMSWSAMEADFKLVYRTEGEIKNQKQSA